MHALWDVLYDVPAAGITIKIHFIPGHSGIEGNEEADRLATDGKSMNQAPLCLDRNIAASRIVQHYTAKRAAVNHGPTYRPPSSHLSFATRWEERTISQLRAGKSPLTQSYHDHQTPTVCRHCRKEPETPHHLIHCCPVYSKQRFSEGIPELIEPGDHHIPHISIYTHPLKILKFLRKIRRLEPNDPPSNFIRKQRR